MKLITYIKDEHEQLALLVDENLYDTDSLHPDLPISMAMFLNYWEDCYPVALAAEQKILEGMVRSGKAIPLSAVTTIMAPVPNPTSLRVANAFRQHVEAERKSRNAAMPEQFDQYPAFCFGNHNSVLGPGEVVCMTDHFQKLDFESGVAIAICKPGRNIPASEADEYIAGLMIMNNMSARVLQMEDMLLDNGPVKGKDFATVTGPMLVTLDELEVFEIPCKENHTGKAWNLPMKCIVNGVEVSAGNVGDMDWTFAEIVERCSYGVNLFPGDVIGSGTISTGCLLELNQTGKLNDPNYQEQWLQEGDVIEMENEALGLLTSTIAKDEHDFSILLLKKNV